MNTKEKRAREIAEAYREYLRLGEVVDEAWRTFAMLCAREHLSTVEAAFHIRRGEPLFKGEVK